MKRLENVKSGDHLILHGRMKSDRRLVTVARTTKTQIIVVNGGRFRKADGYPVGKHSGAWTRPHITLPREGELDEVKEAYHKQHMVEKIFDTCQRHRLKAMSFRQVKRIYSVLTVIEAEDCGGCGKVDPDKVSECPRCGGKKCESCDMGDDVECPSCNLAVV